MQTSTNMYLLPDVCRPPLSRRPGASPRPIISEHDFTRPPFVALAFAITMTATYNDAAAAIAKAERDYEEQLIAIAAAAANAVLGNPAAAVQPMPPPMPPPIPPHIRARKEYLRLCSMTANVHRVRRSEFKRRNYKLHPNAILLPVANGSLPRNTKRRGAIVWRTTGGPRGATSSSVHTEQFPRPLTYQKSKELSANPSVADRYAEVEYQIYQIAVARAANQKAYRHGVEVPPLPDDVWRHIQGFLTKSVCPFDLVNAVPKSFMLS